MTPNRQDWTVPRRWFLHFYVFLSVWNALAWAGLPSGCIAWPSRLALVLVQLHAARRVWETGCLQRSSDKPMHFLIYALGLLHYVAVPLTLVDGSAREPGGARLLGSIALFCLGSWQQHAAHRALAAIRANVQGPVYAVPTAGWFAWCTCPHYLAEMLIYASLMALVCNPASTLMLAWVVGNLSVSAHRCKRWYVQKFPGVELCRTRCAVIPLLL